MANFYGILCILISFLLAIWAEWLSGLFTRISERCACFYPQIRVNISFKNPDGSPILFMTK